MTLFLSEHGKMSEDRVFTALGMANSFNQLLQTSLDFDDAVPFISTYLGHCDLRETDKYLQANYDFFQHDQTLIADYARKNCIFPEVIDE